MTLLDVIKTGLFLNPEERAKTSANLKQQLKEIQILIDYLDSTTDVISNPSPVVPVNPGPGSVAQ